jgi:mono/diheme cytochrome c family protein
MRCRLALLAALGCAAAVAETDTVEFNRDIRPIFSDRCYTCHGPDENKRKSKLRLDMEVGAKSDLGGHFAIVPGNVAHSELIRRVTSDDLARRMPPAYAGAARLTDRQIDLLTRWVAEGARWQKHWSFLPPVRPALPEISGRSWPKNAIDYFVMARLEREGLKPSIEADRRTLIRRVSFDLTGLPPTPPEVDAFLTDRSANAYEKVVERLLSSPRYGERMAMPWLDAARYADTNGYQTDAERQMWRWRDWVIDAFNRNLPYDRFTVEQIAGDLLPGATRDQVLATGFNRNHRANGEGGIIPEEYAVEYVVDRVDTTSTVWMGVTLACARCHDHKFDPFTQKEFYQMFAYFNQVPERGNAFKYGNSPPVIRAPLPDQEARLKVVEQRLSLAERQASALEPRIGRAQAAWETSMRGPARVDGAPDWAPDWATGRALAVHLPLAGDLSGEITADPPRPEKYLYLMENGPVEGAVSFTEKAAWKSGDAQYGAGPIGAVGEFDGKRYVDVGDVGNFGFYDAFTLSAWINPAAGSGTIVSRANDEAEGKGFGLVLKDGRLGASLVQRWLDDGVRVESEQAVPLNRWSHVSLTYDGSRLGSGVRLYLDGRLLRTRIDLDYMNQPFDAKQPLRIGGGLGAENRFRGQMAEVRVYRRALGAEEAAVLAVAEPVSRLVQVPVGQRSAAQSAKLRWCFLERYASDPMQAARRNMLDLREQRDRLVDSFPTVMVMQDSAAPRETHLLVRGAYDRPGQKVEPGVPGVLPPLPAGVPNNRLGLARWLVDRANPLTARVAVNRFWQMYFGVGLVKTVEDFGSQGEWPSNPELLDWLATEFVGNGWDVKALQKTIVMSATYRQLSKATPELMQKDPENRMLARGPRVRLPAEMVRDQALAVSGLLVDKIGGPSVKPYQPAGLWKELSGGDDYKQDHGDGLHRRSLYTYWKRTAPPPMMMNFDAAGREACVVRELRTNTPMQSLDLMNDVTFLEAARKVAERMMREGGSTPGERIAYGFELATARRPGPREQEILMASLGYHRDAFQSDGTSAARYLAQGEAARDQNLDARELAAYAAVASLILNLDATLTKD